MEHWFVQPLREIGTPLADISGPLPFVAVQAAFDEFFQRGTLRSYWKSTYVEELTDPILDIIVDKARYRPSDRTFVLSFLMGGAINRVGGEETAYSERSANWMISIDGNWQDPQGRRQGHFVGPRRVGRMPRARNGLAVPEFHERRR